MGHQISNTIFFSLSLFLLIGLSSCSKPIDQNHSQNMGKVEGVKNEYSKEEDQREEQPDRNAGKRDRRGKRSSRYRESRREERSDRYTEEAQSESSPERGGQSESSLVAENLDDAEQAVWNIDPLGGTGFFISPTHFVTNAHVVVGNGGPNRMRLIERKSNTILIVNKLLALAFYPDLALLEVESPDTFYLEISDETTRLDEKLFMFGFPASRNSKLIVGESIGSIQEGRRTSVRTNFYDHPGGFSGSPMLDSAAYVVGVAHTAPTKNWSLIHFVNREELKTFLKENENYPCEQISYRECRSLAKRNVFYKANQTDNFRAQYQLGFLYEAGGLGFPKNEEKSRYWYGISKKSWDASRRNNQ